MKKNSEDIENKDSLKFNNDNRNNGQVDPEEFLNSETGSAVHARGSLGLLALGAVGIKVWRKAREEAEEKLKNYKKE